MPLLGNLIESALAKVGITSEKVSTFLGKPCSCKKRRDKLNQVDAWARRVIAGKVEDAKEYLNRIMGEPGEGPGKQL